MTDAKLTVTQDDHDRANAAFDAMVSTLGNKRRVLVDHFARHRIDHTRPFDLDLGKIGPGHVCKHGIRWPHACNDCDRAALRARNPHQRRGGEMMLSPRLYVASRASIPERSAMWRGIRDRGVLITSSWIDEAGEGETECNADLWRRITREIYDADALVLYVEQDDFPLKGALVEVGMALGMGKRVAVVASTVQLEAKSLRPLGSWAMHPRVTFHQTVRHAIAHFAEEPTP